MGDNGRRERGWPRREGWCPHCRRFLLVNTGRTLPRHICKDGTWATNIEATIIYPDDDDGKGRQDA